MSCGLRMCMERWPIGSRVSIERFRWIDAKLGQYESIRIDGTVTKHWRATGDRPGINVLCDDGIETSGEPCILNAREATGRPAQGGMRWCIGCEPGGAA